MKIEDAVWPIKEGQGRLSKSTAALKELKVGDVKRITHDDVKCIVGQGTHGVWSCSLVAAVVVLRRVQGWRLDYIHEKQGVMVVRRTA